MSTGDLLVLAEVIARADLPVCMLEAIRRCGEDVIKGRQSYIDFYAGQPVEPDGEVARSNASHVYFVDVLKQVLNMIPSAKVMGASWSGRAGSSMAQPDEATKLSNLFEKLAVEDSGSEEADDSGIDLVTVPVKPRKCKTKKSQPKSGKPDEIQSSADIDFEPIAKDDSNPVSEAWCLLQDLRDIRVCILDTWQEHQRGEVSRLAACMVTDLSLIHI